MVTDLHNKISNCFLCTRCCVIALLITVTAVINGSSRQKRWKMSWKQDEPKVIDDEMLQQAIVEQGPQGQAGKIAKKEGIQYEEVFQLRLDFRSK